MSADVFVDTNVFVYLFDGDAPAKQEKAREILEVAGRSGRLALSTQVLQEFYVTVTRKLGDPLSELEALDTVRRLSAFHVVQIDAPMVVDSIELSQRHQTSLWDGLIIQAALSAGCARLLTEDLQDGWVVKGLRVENPFRGLS